MDQKNTETILETLAEKIRDLETEVSFREYEIEKLKEEKKKLEAQYETLLRKNAELNEHLTPTRKWEERKDGKL